MPGIIAELRRILRFMPVNRTKKPVKPTVFLSHASVNRRELVALKRLLDERAGGLIEFFLSSDDDSIGHGTIWSAEVRAALDRMNLMVLFASADALKSSWTYFEAGYGLHKLETVKIYCLPGTDKATLPSPFNILQNRNLHSARDISLLIKQINETLGARINDVVGPEDYNRIFKRPTVGQVSFSPRLELLLDSIEIEALGPPNSAEVFRNVCERLALQVSTTEVISQWGAEHEELCSTGVRLSVPKPDLSNTADELEITDQMRAAGYAQITDFGGSWLIAKGQSYLPRKTVSIKDIEIHNEEIRAQNLAIEAENAEELRRPKDCSFKLSPINFSVPSGVVDDWWHASGNRPRMQLRIKFLPEIKAEVRAEAITAKIHGSPLSLRNDGTLLWEDGIVVRLGTVTTAPTITAKPLDEDSASLSDFHIEELVSTLFELGIVSASQRGGKRR